mmetsp:Transcript_21272/g.25590  ORF Transcript_21272/g.25590 Transcript_21272/m.25590 type:complete len:278 (+) Transcript_21272:110-943(+)
MTKRIVYWEFPKKKPTKQVEERRCILSLRDLCVGVLARHFDAIEAGFSFDPQLYLDLLSNPNCRASPEAVARIESTHPELESKITDNIYWKQRQLCLDAASRDITPFPQALERLDTLHLVLKRWLAEDEKDQKHENRRIKQIQFALSGRLERFPITLEVLSASKIGRTLATIVKCIAADHPNAQSIRSQATHLLNDWKAVVQNKKVQDTPETYIRSRLSACTSWKQLYFVLLKAEDLRYRRFIRKRDGVLQSAAERKRDIIPIDLSEVPIKRRRRSS